MVKKYLKRHIEEFIVSDKTAILNIRTPGFDDPCSIVQVYAPTEQATQDEKTEFYTKLGATMENKYSQI